MNYCLDLVSTTTAQCFVQLNNYALIWGIVIGGIVGLIGYFTSNKI